MKLSGLADMDLWEAEQALTEGTGKLRTFDYASHKTDPRPTVLVLGHWKNQSTGNDLLGGININYMTDAELQRLRRAVPIILRARDLKSRYWVGRRLLPDIFTEYYRTYKQNNVAKVTPGELSYGLDKAAKDATKPDGGQADASRLRKAAEIIKKQIATRDPKPDQATGVPDAGDPLPRSRPGSEPRPGPATPVSPEAGLDNGDDKGDAGPDWRSLLKAAARRKQDVQKPDVKKPEAQKSVPLKPPAKPGQPMGPTPPKLPPKPGPLDDEEAKAESRGYRRHSVLGLLWESASAYRRWHSPSRFLTTPELALPGRSPMAVHDVISGETLIDAVHDHAEIIDAAGWDYSHVIRLSAGPDGTLDMRHDGLPPEILERAGRRIPAVVSQALADGGFTRP